MLCGSCWRRCWRIRRVVSAIRAGLALARASVWRGSSLCSTRIRRGCKCPSGSSVCRAARRVGGGWRSGRGGALRRGDPAAPGAARRGGEARLVAGARGCLPGRGEKGGEKVARTLRGTAGSRFQLLVEAGGLPPRAGERERAALPCCRSSMRSPRRGSGRRNWGPTAVTPPAPTSRRSPSARPAPDPLPDQPTPQTRPADPRRSIRARGLGAASNADSSSPTPKPATAGRSNPQTPGLKRSPESAPTATAKPTTTSPSSTSA